MYVEKINLGESEARTIVSGLRNHISIEDFEGKQVVVVCNLKPRKLRGILSSGMVLCASNEDHSKVELLCPSETVPNGSQVVVEGLDCSEPLKRLNPKKKIWEQVVVHLRSDGECKATYKTNPLVIIDNTNPVPPSEEGEADTNAKGTDESRSFSRSVGVSCETLVDCDLG